MQHQQTETDQRKHNLTVRITANLREQAERTAECQGFMSLADFIRHLIQVAVRK